jgi:hypothetical protein
MHAVTCTYIQTNAHTRIMGCRKSYDDEIKAKLKRMAEWREIFDNLEYEESQGFMYTSNNTIHKPTSAGDCWPADEVHHNVISDGTNRIVEPDQKEFKVEEP